MKRLMYVTVFLGMSMFLVGCTSTAQSQLNGLNGNGCNNPKCKCPKPCQCGADCRCGMNGNKLDLNTKK